MNSPSSGTLYAALAEEYRALVEHDVATMAEGERFRRLLTVIVQSYLEDLDLAAMIGMRIEELETQLARIEERADAKRHLVAQKMASAGQQTLSAPGFFVERCETPAPLLIERQADIPARFWKQGSAEVDRDQVLAALRAGELLTGAKLGMPGTSITVRAR